LGATGWELVDLVARWIHVIAGTMWIGNSMLFNWLDRNLEKPGSRCASGSIGEIWLLHSGAFYYVDKTLLGEQKMPRPMHWFFVQAYTTWWSGLVLLVAVYWFGGRAELVDETVQPLQQVSGLFFAVGSILVGWALYESMNRFVSPRMPKIAAAVWVTGLTAIAVALTQLLNGRAAFLHVGAMLGTIMAANVVLTIMPSQRELVASVKEGRGGDPAVSARAKRVSIHNNYFTFPVIVLMLSNHFASLYGNRYNWLILLILIAAGATVRHVMNIRFNYRFWKPALAGTVLVGIVAVYGAIRLGNSPNFTFGPGPSSRPLPSQMTFVAVSFADVRHVIDRRCAACHSANPVDMTYGGPPLGVKFDTPEEIMARRERIYQRAVLTRTMPPGNKTRITEEERRILNTWSGNPAGNR
jgi:uncharacterized membrane protein